MARKILRRAGIRRLADCTAVMPDQLESVYEAIPGVGFPVHLPHVLRLDFGPDFTCGVATTLPPVEGKPYPHFVPAVDRDGQRGDRHPSARFGRAAGHLHGLEPAPPADGGARPIDRLVGLHSSLPGDRRRPRRTNDPRRSIAERYPGRDSYLEQVRQAAKRLIDEGYLLAEDLYLGRPGIAALRASCGKA